MDANVSCSPTTIQFVGLSADGGMFQFEFAMRDNVETIGVLMRPLNVSSHEIVFDGVQLLNREDILKATKTHLSCAELRGGTVTKFMRSLAEHNALQAAQEQERERKAAQKKREHEAAQTRERKAAQTREREVAQTQKRDAANVPPTPVCVTECHMPGGSGWLWINIAGSMSQLPLGPGNVVEHASGLTFARGALHSQMMVINGIEMEEVRWMLGRKLLVSVTNGIVKVEAP